MTEQYFSVIESNVIHLLDQLASNKFVDYDKFNNIIIDKDRVAFEWRDQEAVIEFDAQSTLISPWKFNYQQVVHERDEQNVTTLCDVVCNYEIILRLTELTNNVVQYEVTNIKQGHGFCARVICSFVNETPHITLTDGKKNVYGAIKLNNTQYLTPNDVHFYKCKNIDNVSINQIVEWANDFNIKYKTTNWEASQLLWDISSMNKRPEEDYGYNQRVVKKLDEDNLYDDFE